ncbi:MAG: TonB-dependent receptor [Saprospiraceae bacterium]|nr:TonB-dependent receptor [Saprospiraceae bacterium]
MAVFIKDFLAARYAICDQHDRSSKTETSLNYEVGYRYHSSGFNAQLVGFINNYGNILGSDNVSGGGAGTGDMFNAGHAKIQGLEIGLEYDLLHKKTIATGLKLPISIAYTYTDATFQETFVNGGGDWGSGTIYKRDVIPFVTPHLLTTSTGIENKDLMLPSSGDIRAKQEQTWTRCNHRPPPENVKYNDVNDIVRIF